MRTREGALHSHTALSVCPLARQLSPRDGSRVVGRGSTYPDVHLGPIIFLPFEELRGGVGRAATPRLQQLPGGEEVAEAEV